jgi:histidyl-tRNA synthetase
MSRVCKVFGCCEIQTPLVEQLALFQRAAPELEISKELFQLTGKGEEILALRPENTAGVLRAICESGVKSIPKSHPIRFFYSGPMFRYERPQKGRFRQFIQFGVEMIRESSHFSDVEGIDLAVQCLEEMGLRIQEDFCIEINSIGDLEARKSYCGRLKEYLQREPELSRASRERLDQNRILRILDSKEPQDHQIFRREDFPKLFDFLSNESKQRFQQVISELETLKIPVELNSNLVRGLDYYNDTVFEVVARNRAAEILGIQQKTLLAGGRYDSLGEQLGYDSLPCFGWAAGIDRLYLVLNELGRLNALQNDSSKVYVCLADFDQEIKSFALLLVSSLRRHSIQVAFDFDSSLKKQISSANALGFDFAVLIGKEERQKQEISLKNLKESTQSSIPLSQDLTNLEQLLQALERN